MTEFCAEGFKDLYVPPPDFHPASMIRPPFVG